MKITNKDEFNLVKYVVAAAECTLKNGYHSTAIDDSTSTYNTALNLYVNLSFDDLDIDDRKARDLAFDSLEWISNCDDNSEYILKLKNIVDKEFISLQDARIIASLPKAFLNHKRYEDKKLEKEEERKLFSSVSTYQGTIGYKVSFDVANIKEVSHWDSDFGVVFLYQIIDTNNNVYTWKTSKIIEEDEISHMSGTVKDHNEYNGIKQTVLTRCKFN